MVRPPPPWRYQFPLPMADYRTNRAAIQPGFCVDLKGVDARHTGALRLFPGMKTAHYNENVTPSTSSPVDFFKCISVLWSGNGSTFHGYVYRLRKDVTAVPTNLHRLAFVLYDSTAATWRTLYHPLRSVNAEIDVAVNGKFIHVAEEGYPGDTLWLDPDDASQWATTRQFGCVRAPALSTPGMSRVGGFGEVFSNDPNTIYKVTISGTSYLALRIAMGVGVRLVDTYRGTSTPLVTLDSTNQITRATTFPLTAFPYDDFFVLSAERGAGWATLLLNQAELTNYNQIELWRTVNNGSTYFREKVIDWEDDGPTPATTHLGIIGNVWGTLGFNVTTAVYSAPNTTITIDAAGFEATGLTDFSLWSPTTKESFPINSRTSDTVVVVTGDASAYAGTYMVLVPTVGPLYRRIGNRVLDSATDLGGGQTRLVAAAGGDAFTAEMATNAWTVTFPLTRRQYVVTNVVDANTLDVTGAPTVASEGPAGSTVFYVEQSLATLYPWWACANGPPYRIGAGASVRDVARPFRVHGRLNDQNLIYQTPYSWTLDASGTPPYGSRLAYAGGLCVKLANGGSDNLQRGDIGFSNPYQLEGENFPAGNTLSPSGSLRSDCHSIIAAGSFFFVLGKSGVYRMTRIGGTVGGQAVVDGWGPVNRYAACVVDNMLAMVAPHSLVIMNTNDGTYQTLGAVERIIQEEWKDDHASISLAYDARMSVLVMYNSAKEEAVLVWLTTNTVTRLADIRARMVVDGLDFYGNGQRRAYFVCDGMYRLTLLEFDTFREYAYPNMAGLEDTVALSGTMAADVAAGTQLTAAQLGLATVTHRYRGYYFYVVRDGVAHRHRISSTVTGSGTERITVVNTLPALSAGDVWMIAPVVFGVVGWPLDIDPEPPRDLFTRRKMLAVGGSFHLRNGTYYDAHPDGLQVWAEGFNQLSSTPSKRTLIPSVSEGADHNYGSVPISGHLVCPGLKVLSVGVDFDLLSLITHGTIERTEKNAD